LQANKYVSIWDNGNRESVTVDTYMSAVDAMKPDAYVALCDGETPKNCPTKRIAKSVAKTLQCLDDTLVLASLKTSKEMTVEMSTEMSKKTSKEMSTETSKEISTSTFLFGVVEGGYDAKARRLSAEQLAKR
jgi:hypothetical protein